MLELRTRKPEGPSHKYLLPDELPEFLVQILDCLPGDLQKMPAVSIKHGDY